MRATLRGIVVFVALFTVPAFAATVGYVYDELGRLIAVIEASGATTRYTYDAAGNLLSVTRDTSNAFRVDGFTPGSGKSGDAVTIFGAGFIASPSQNSVSFNGTPATITQATPHSLIVLVPSGASTGTVAVSNANGSASTTQSFTVISPPTIAATSPTFVVRGQTMRVEITGTQLDSASAVAFAQSGLSARIVARQPAKLTVDIASTGTVPFGSYAFSVTNYAGTTQSGAVTIAVTAALVGPAASVARPVTVHVPAALPGAPAGNAASVAQPLTVHVPALVPGAPAGNAASVAQPVTVTRP